MSVRGAAGGALGSGRFGHLGGARRHVGSAALPGRGGRRYRRRGAPAGAGWVAGGTRPPGCAGQQRRDLRRRAHRGAVTGGPAPGVEVNLVAVLDMCRLTAPLLLAAPAASVINVASMYGIVASREPMAAYNATKGALVNLTRQLAA